MVVTPEVPLQLQAEVLELEELEELELSSELELEELVAPARTPLTQLQGLVLPLMM